MKLAATTIAVVALTFLLFGNWVPAYFSQPMLFINERHNMWQGLWPFQVPVGIALVLLGIERNDRLVLLGASPFLSPYAATSTLLGPWILLVTRLKGWQTALILAAWWGAVIYRTFF